MIEPISVDLLRSDDWQRYRAIRLRSLEINPEAFGGSFEAESQWSEVEWRTEMAKFVALVAVLDNADVAVMNVEVLDGDHGATCWIGGCWSDPAVRGKGAFRALFTYVDAHAAEFGWSKHGLGVWHDNDSAIAAYSALGFRFAGEPMESTRKPGLFYIHMIRDSIL